MHVQKIFKFFVWLALATPVFFVPSLFVFPYIVPKVLLFRSIVCVLVGLLAFEVVSGRKKFSIDWTPITIFVALFLASMFFSSVVGVDPYRSFWDGHERMLGVFTVIHFVLFYFACTAGVKNTSGWRQLMWVFVVVANVVISISLLQKIWPDFFYNHGQDRPVSTLGNPIYVGGYGMFLIGIAFIQLFQVDKRWQKVALCLSVVVGACGVIVSGTRGVFLGVCAGAVSAGMWYAFFSKIQLVRKVAFLLLFVAGLMTSALFLFRSSAFVQHIPTVGRLVNTDLHSGTSETRLMAWSIAVQSWRERPVFGWGPNNFLYAFNAHYRPEFLEHGWNETWFDNAHNTVLNTLTTQGLVGILVFFGLFLSIIWTIVRLYRSGSFTEGVAVSATGLVAAHFVQGVFVFEQPVSYLCFFFLLSFLNAQYVASLNVHAAPEPLSAKSTPLFVSGVIVVVVFFTIIVTNINPARANLATFRLLRSLGYLQNPIEPYKRAMSIWTPHADDIRSEFGRMAIGASVGYKNAGQSDIARQILVYAYDGLQKNIEQHPQDVRFYLQQVEVMDKMSSLFNQVDSLVDAEKKLQTALRLSPRRQQTLYMLALVQLKLHKNQEAIDTLRQVLADDLNIGESWWRLALMYQSQGRIADAQAVVREARQRGVRIDQRSPGLQIFESILPLSTQEATSSPRT